MTIGNSVANLESMSRIDRRAREKQFEQLAADSLKDHIILPKSVEGRWQIGKPKCGFYRAELIVTFCNSLIIHGDVELVNYFSYSGPGGDRGVVRWVALSSTDYLASKVARGTSPDAAWCYDPDVALDDAYDQIECAKKNPEDYPKEWVKTWTKVVNAISRGDHMVQIQQLIYDETGDAELCDIGKCPAPRVFWGKHLARKLFDLLGETP